MKKFSISRFLKISHYYFSDNRRSWLKRYWAVLELMLTLLCVDTISKFTLGTSEYLYWLFHDLKFEIIMAMLFFVFLDGTSMINRYVNTKGARIGLFMLPSSNAEKFFPLVVESYTMACLYMVMGVASADVVNYALQWLLGFDNPTFILTGLGERFIEYCGAKGLTGVPLYLAIAKTTLSWVCLSTLILFSSIALRKNRRLTILYLAFILSLASHFMILSKTSGVTDACDVVASDAIIAIVVRIGIFVLCLWASYRSFTHMQIVDQKWINL